MNLLRARRSAAFTPSLMLLSWAAVNVFDALLTYTHLGWGGTEANPILHTLQSEVGSTGMLVLKVTFALMVGLALTRTGKQRYLSIAAACMSLVVIWNAALVPAVMAAGH